MKAVAKLWPITSEYPDAMKSCAKDKSPPSYGWLYKKQSVIISVQFSFDISIIIKYLSVTYGMQDCVGID